MLQSLMNTENRMAVRSGYKRVCSGYFSLIVLSLYLHACSKEKIDAPAAIKELIAGSHECTSCPSFVDKYLWRNQVVYIYTCNGPACDCMVFYYNEKGETLTMEQGYSFDDFRKEAQLTTHVWTCKK